MTKQLSWYVSGMRCVFHAVILTGPVAVVVCGWEMVVTGGAEWQIATIAAGAVTLAAHVAEQATRR